MVLRVVPVTVKDKVVPAGPTEQGTARAVNLTIGLVVSHWIEVVRRLPMAAFLKEPLKTVETANEATLSSTLLRGSEQVTAGSG